MSAYVRFKEKKLYGVLTKLWAIENYCKLCINGDFNDNTTMFDRDCFFHWNDTSSLKQKPQTKMILKILLHKPLYNPKYMKNLITWSSNQKKYWLQHIGIFETAIDQICQNL